MKHLCPQAIKPVSSNTNKMSATSTATAPAVHIHLTPVVKTAMREMTQSDATQRGKLLTASNVTTRFVTETGIEKKALIPLLAGEIALGRFLAASGKQKDVPSDPAEYASFVAAWGDPSRVSELCAIAYATNAAKANYADAIVHNKAQEGQRTGQTLRFTDLLAIARDTEGKTTTETLLAARTQKATEKATRTPGGKTDPTKVTPATPATPPPAPTTPAQAQAATVALAPKGEDGKPRLSYLVGAAIGSWLEAGFSHDAIDEEFADAMTASRKD